MLGGKIMMQQLVKRVSSITLCAVSLCSFVNILGMFWVPIILPLSSYSIVRMAFVAFIEERYYLLVIGLVICLLLLLTAISINRDRIILPIISLLYLMCDLFIVLFLLFCGISDGYWYMYIIQVAVIIILTIILSVYIVIKIRSKHKFYKSDNSIN